MKINPNIELALFLDRVTILAFIYIYGFAITRMHPMHRYCPRKYYGYEQKFVCSNIFTY